MISSTTPFSRQIYFKCHRSISAIALEVYLFWGSLIVDEIYFSSWQKISLQLGKFLGVLNRLDKREKGAIQAYLVKNKLQKTRQKVWWFKRKAYLCTRNRETTMVAKAIFEDIYIIRQVVQESESSISIKSTVNKMTLGYDEETESGLRI